MTELDRLNLKDLSLKYPKYGIRFDAEFLSGTIKKPFGLIPNNWNGKTINVSYRDKKG